MNKLQSERIGRIERLKVIITRINKHGCKLKEKEFVMEVMKIMRVSSFTAREYIRQAKFELK